MPRVSPPPPSPFPLCRVYLPLPFRMLFAEQRRAVCAPRWHPFPSSPLLAVPCPEGSSPGTLGLPPSAGNMACGPLPPPLPGFFSLSLSPEHPVYRYPFLFSFHYRLSLRPPAGPSDGAQESAGRPRRLLIAGSSIDKRRLALANPASAAPSNNLGLTAGYVALSTPPPPPFPPDSYHRYNPPLPGPLPHRG